MVFSTISENTQNHRFIILFAIMSLANTIVITALSITNRLLRLEGSKSIIFSQLANEREKSMNCANANPHAVCMLTLRYWLGIYIKNYEFFLKVTKLANISARYSHCRVIFSYALLI